jgi:hypothetical protein
MYLSLVVGQTCLTINIVSNIISRLTGEEPTLSKRPLNKLIYVRLSERDFVKFEEFCEDNGFTRSGWLRDMVKFVTDKKQSHAGLGHVRND